MTIIIFKSRGVTNEHLADLVMMNADVETVYNIQCRFIDFRNDRMIRLRTRVDNPQAIVVSVEIDDIELCCVKSLSAVDRV